MLSQQLLTCFLVGAGAMIAIALLSELLSLATAQFARWRQRRRLNIRH
jgi:hypothetical protein